MKYLNLNANNNSFEIIGTGVNGVIIKVGDNYYKLCQGDCSDFIKTQKLTKLNNLLSDKNNKLIKIYQSNMTPKNSEYANVLKLDYQKPAQMKTQNDLFNCIKDLCEGVKYLHDNEFVYRDMKLDNTLITKNEEEKICLRIIDPDEITKANSKMLNLRPSRTQLVDKLPFVKSTKSLDIYMVGNTIKELLDLCEKTEGVESRSSNSKKLIIEFIDDCHAFFNDGMLSKIIEKINKKEFMQ